MNVAALHTPYFHRKNVVRTRVSIGAPMSARLPTGLQTLPLGSVLDGGVAYTTSSMMSYHVPILQDTSPIEQKSQRSLLRCAVSTLEDGGKSPPRRYSHVADTVSTVLCGLSEPAVLLSSPPTPTRRSMEQSSRSSHGSRSACNAGNDVRGRWSRSSISDPIVYSASPDARITGVSNQITMASAGHPRRTVFEIAPISVVKLPDATATTHILAGQNPKLQHTSVVPRNNDEVTVEWSTPATLAMPARVHMRTSKKVTGIIYDGESPVATAQRVSDAVTARLQQLRISRASRGTA